MEKRQGVYIILNIKDNIKYIGSARHIYNRIAYHKRTLNEGTHYNKKLQDDWIILGEQMFIFKIIEEVEDESKLRERERYYIGFFKEAGIYNLSIPDNGIGTISHAEETKDKLKRITNNWIKNNPEEVKSNKEKAKLAIEEDKKLYPEKYKRKNANLKTQKIVAEDKYICHIFDSITQASEILNLGYKRIGEVLIGKKNIGVGKYKEVSSHKGWKFYYYNDRYNRKEQPNIISLESSIGFENFS